MRKFLILCLSILLLLLPFAGVAFAAEAAGAEIPVVIDGGGTAYMIPEVNCPLPTKNAIQVDNGRTGHFYINFTEAGVYHYTITAEFSENGKTWKADDVYRLTVEVYEKEDGTLYTVSTINNSHTTEKGAQVWFHKPPETTTQPPTTTDTTTPTTSPPQKPGTPRTGDESNLTRYVLIAMASSAGLFLLALLYTLNTNRLIKEGED